MGGETERDVRQELQVFIACRRDTLVKAAEKILGNHDEAEDIVQDTLVAVWQRLEKLQPRKARGYVFRAVQFNALKHRARRRQHLSLDAAPLLVAKRAREEEYIYGIDPFTLERALAGLPETQQVVLRMKYYLGLTFRETGRALSISANTAASRSRYALAALRKVLIGRKSQQKS